MDFAFDTFQGHLTYANFYTTEEMGNNFKFFFIFSVCFFRMRDFKFKFDTEILFNKQISIDLHTKEMNQNVSICNFN